VARGNQSSKWKQFGDDVPMSKKKRIPVDGDENLVYNPFANLKSDSLPPAPEEIPTPSVTNNLPPQKNRGRLNIIRQTAGRGGKTVTVVTGFIGIGLSEKEELASAMRKACGTGGTVKAGRIEIQGDKRDVIARILTEAGFRPVFAGG
jgi:translation initiation factor 1